MEKGTSTVAGSPGKIDRSKSIREIYATAKDYVKIAKIAVKMTEEERCDFFDWWNYSRHEQKNPVSEAKRSIRDVARFFSIIR